MIHDRYEHQIDTLIQSETLEMNINLLKNILALKHEKAYVSGATLAKVLLQCTTSSARTTPTERDAEEIFILLLSRCDWSDDEFESELLKADACAESFLGWLKKHNTELNPHFLNKLLKLPSILFLIRSNVIYEQLKSIVTSYDADVFERQCSQHFAPATPLIKAIEGLPDEIIDAVHAYLAHTNWLALREYFRGSENGFESKYLDKLIAYVDKDSTLMLSKFIKYGVSPEAFQQHTQMSVELWCEENGYSDLLELEQVKRSCQLVKFRNALTNNDDIKQLESEIILFLDKYYPQDAGMAQLEIVALSDKYLSLWEIAADNQMLNLLDYPHLLPTENATISMHKALFVAAQKNHVEVVERLIHHAAQFMPDALRFSNKEKMEIKNKELIQKMAEALRPRSTQDKILDFVISGLNFFVPEITTDTGVSSMFTSVNQNSDDEETMDSAFHLL